jgi:hypothetical protein
LAPTEKLLPPQHEGHEPLAVDEGHRLLQQADALVEGFILVWN